MDPLDLFQGTTPQEVEHELRANAEESAHVVKTTRTEGWSIIMKWLDEVKGNHKRDPSAYCNDTNLANFDSGVVSTIENIENFIQQSKQIIETYEQARTKAEAD